MAGASQVLIPDVFMTQCGGNASLAEELLQVRAAGAVGFGLAGVV